jgi:hypothetical protein
MSKRMELVAALIALGLFLNAFVGFYRIVRPVAARAQSAITDVNVVRVGGQPLSVVSFSDSTAAPRAVIDLAAGGSQAFPVFVKMTP